MTKRTEQIRERLDRKDNHGRLDDCDLCGCMLTRAEEEYLLDRVEMLEESAPEEKAKANQKAEE